MSTISIVDDFFAPTETDLIDNLVAKHKVKLNGILHIANSIHGNEDHFKYFLTAQTEGYRINTKNLFDSEKAIKVLNAESWDSALRMTDVLSIMPQKRIDEWNKQIHEFDTPAFEDEIVRETIFTLLHQRSQFFAERIDGVFRALSGDHITNRPEGFYKRMIMNNIMDPKYQMINTSSRYGYITDLRYVVNKVLRRSDSFVNRYSTYSILNGMKDCFGEWVTIDGGSIRIKLFKKGTVHIEIHPDVAWQLNKVLASIYPMAIPASFRTKENKIINKDFGEIQEIIPGDIIKIISELRIKNNSISCLNRSYYESNKNLKKAVDEIFEYIGGEREGDDWYFDYNPTLVIKNILVNGTMPERKSHQFYPTLPNLAKILLDLCGDFDDRILDDNSNISILEPSAGQGGIYDFLPKSSNITLVELNHLHCDILKSKCNGFDNHIVYCADFIEWQKISDSKFDFILMNPPFSEGRAILHVNAALKLLKDDGILGAILPASMKGVDKFSGYKHYYSNVYSHEFNDTSVSVVLLILQK